MDHRAGLERADDLLDLARELGDPAHLLQAHHCQWATLYMLGAHEECCRHADEGISALRPGAAPLARAALRRPRPEGLRAGRAGVVVLAARTVGREPRQRSARAASGRSRWRTWAAACTRWTTRSRCTACGGMRPRSRACANELVAFAGEQRLSEHRAKGMLFRGWAKAHARRCRTAASREMRDALAWEEEAGTPEDFPLYYEMFAEVCGRAGRFTEGLDAVGKAFAQAERGRLVYWNAELHRRRGELLLAAGGDSRPWPAASSTPWPTRAPRARGFLELRAAASLARLRRDEGGGGRRRAWRLRAAYAGFPRGLDAPDLRDARALLGRLP